MLGKCGEIERNFHTMRHSINLTDSRDHKQTVNGRKLAKSDE